MKKHFIFTIKKKLNTLLFKDTHLSWQRKISRAFQYLIEHKFHKDKNREPLAIYDLNINPVTFDFCPFLYMANNYFENKGIKKFDLIIVLNDDDELELVKKQRVTEILMPIVNMCSRIKSFQIIGEKNLKKFNLKKKIIYPNMYSNLFKRQWDYHNYLNNDYVKKRDSIIEPTKSSIEIIENWLNKKKIKEYITITIRNSKFHDTARNSNLLLIKEFTDWVLVQGIGVIIIPDSDNEDIGEINSGVVCDIASYNLYHRVALYKLSNLNIFNNNGPSVIPQIGGMRFMITGIHNENSEFAKEEVINRVGLGLGQQPFNKDLQGYFLWGKEDIESLKINFLRLINEARK